ncbi:MAG TPA: DUF4870 domain-containing protein [Thermoanaerobaculia bacterium]|nr:DUF4870 domain-containing protein [Thermoanaerobaculia bacterium]
MSSIPPTVPPPPGRGSYVPPPPPPPSGTGGSSDRTIFLVLSYLGILSLIPFFVKKDDREVQWHAKNGVALFGAEVVWVVIQLAISFAHIPMLGCITGIVGCFVWIGFIAISIVCIVKAVNGQRFRIPMITDMAEKM